MTTLVPVAGSLVKARMTKKGQPYDLWAIVIRNDADKANVRVSVIEVVPKDINEWMRLRVEPPKAGSEVVVLKSRIDIVIHPRRRMTKNSLPQFIIRLNNGRVSNIYTTGDSVAEVRLVDMARHYNSDDARGDFHRDVLVTRRGIEELDVGHSIG